MDGSRQAGAGTGAGTGPAAVLDYDSSDMEDDGHLVGEGPEVRALLGGEGVPSQATKTAVGVGSTAATWAFITLCQVRSTRSAKVAEV